MEFLAMNTWSNFGDVQYAKVALTNNLPLVFLFYNDDNKPVSHRYEQLPGVNWPQYRRKAAFFFCLVAYLFIYRCTCRSFSIEQSDSCNESSQHVPQLFP